MIRLLTCAARRKNPRCTWSVNDTGSSKSAVFCNVAHIFGEFRVFPAMFILSTYTDKNNRTLRWRYGHSHPGIVSHPSSVTMGHRRKLRSTGTAGSSIESQCCVLIHFFGQSLFRKMMKFWCIFHFDLCVCAHGITCLSRAFG